MDEKYYFKAPCYCTSDYGKKLNLIVVFHKLSCILSFINELDMLKT